MKIKTPWKSTPKRKYYLLLLLFIIKKYIFGHWCDTILTYTSYFIKSVQKIPMDPIPQDRDEKRFAIWSSKVNVTRKIQSSSSKTQISFAQKVLVRSSDTFLSSASDNQRYRSSLLIALKISNDPVFISSAKPHLQPEPLKKAVPYFPFQFCRVYYST